MKLDQKLDSLIRENVAAKLFPACAIGVMSNGQKFTVCGGTFTYEDTRPIQADSIFDVASITKAIPTSCLALKLVDESRLKLDDDVTKYLPEFTAARGKNVTIWHLLTQTITYSYYLSHSKGKAPQEILEMILTSPIKTSRSEVTYTNSTSILLGLVVEKIYGKSLDQAAQEIFFGPLGMDRTTFEPLKIAAKEDIVPTENDGWRGRLVHGEVHDESAHSLLPKAVGSAGLFSTAPDLLKFMEVLLGRGQTGGKRYFSEEIVGQMAANQLKGSKEVTGLGWSLDQPQFMGSARGTFGRTGFTGCAFFCNLKLETGLVVLSNHIYPKRRNDYRAINDFRAAAADIVFGAA